MKDLKSALLYFILYITSFWKIVGSSILMAYVSNIVKTEGVTTYLVTYGTDPGVLSVMYVIGDLRNSPFLRSQLSLIPLALYCITIR